MITNHTPKENFNISKQILHIIGDSFSSTTEYLPYNKSFGILLENEYNINQLAKPGLSNEEILEVLIKNMLTFKKGDCLLLQLTYPMRGYFNGRPTGNPNIIDELKNVDLKLYETGIKYLEYMINGHVHYTHNIYNKIKLILNNINNLLNNEIKIGIIYVHTLDSKKIQIPDYENNTIYIMDKFIDVDSFTKSAEPGIYHTKPDTNNHFSDLGNQIMYQSIFSYFKNRN